MGYYLYMKQSGEGCDYSISCGEKLVPLGSARLADAEPEIRQIFEDHGLHSGKPDLDSAIVFEDGMDVMHILRKMQDQYEDERKADELKEKKAKLEQLKRELGEA